MSNESRAHHRAATAAGRPALFVHEYVTGGGWPNETPPPFADEAGAMVRAVLEDLQAWGRFDVVTTRDRRRRDPALPADRIVPLGARAGSVLEQAGRNVTGELGQVRQSVTGDRGDYRAALLRAAEGCDAALVIAPETGGALETVSAWLEDAGMTVLGSTPAAIAVAADKWECQQRFESAGLPAPETVRVTPRDAADAARRMGLPVVLKPLDGAGCDGVAVVRNDADLTPALALPALASTGVFLVQRYVPGEAASVSLVAAGGAARALSLNSQRVREGIPCAYAGGDVAIAHERRDEACELAARAVSLVPGLCGYVGVDLVLGADGCSLIEINPRLTTSYVGLRRALRVNLAEIHWRARVHGTLPATAPCQATHELACGEAVSAHA